MKRYLLSLLVLAALVSSAFALEPVNWDLVMQAGEDYVLNLQLTSCADVPLPVPPAVCKSSKVTKLTGYSYKAQFRSAAAPAGTIYANLSTVFSDMTGGRVDIKLSKAQTAANSGRAGVWDLQQTDSGGQVSYIIRGKAAVSPTVTQ